MSRASRWLFSTSAIAVLAWIEYLVSVLLPAIYRPSPLALEADDAMRLAQVRDLLNGQSWWDLTQWRLSPPAGTVMHWTRIVDAPLATLILFFRFFTSHQTAEILAVSVWPVLLLLPAWLAVARIATRLADREAGLAALFLAITCVLTLGYFKPGEIDHHNAQLVLTLWTTALVLEIEISPRALGWCGALCGISLGIGLETLPYVLSISAIVAGFWIWRGEAVAASARHFGLAFAGTAAFLTIAIVSKQARFHADCTTFSGIYETCTIVGGLGLTALMMFPPLGASVTRRTISITALLILLLLIVTIFAPVCLGGPYYYITPEINRIWLSHIQEAQPAFSTMRPQFAFFFATYVYAIASFISYPVLIALGGRESRQALVIVGIIAGLALAVSTFELRGLPFAIMLGLPGLAAAIRLFSVRFLSRGLVRAVAMIGLLAICSELSFDLIGVYLLEGSRHVEQRLAAQDRSETCMKPEAVASLRTLPKGQVAAFVDTAPTVLLYTPDSVTAGSYRDPDAIEDLYRIYTAKSSDALNIIRRRKIDYLLVCENSPDFKFYLNSSGADGLIQRIATGELPGWLKGNSKSGMVQVYRVTPLSNAAP